MPGEPTGMPGTANAFADGLSKLLWPLAARYQRRVREQMSAAEHFLEPLVMEKPMAKADIALLIVGIIALASALGWPSRA